NVALAAFNLLPAFPMDGGRVLRAVLARNRPFVEATRTAARVGKLFAALLGVVGLLGLNVVLVGVAFFIYVGATGEVRQAELRASFEGVTVGDLMTPLGDLRTVPPEMPVSDLVALLFRERHTGYPVVDDGTLVGIVTLEDLRTVPADDRGAYRVEDVMTTDLETVRVDANPVDALARMQQAGVGRLPVVDDRGAMVGLLSRTDLLAALTVGRPAGLLDELRRASPGSALR
ncbi:MAG: CBS domain-containing protein, partial [Halobacteriaceae archaeon]